jgi:hypothetical protein
MDPINSVEVGETHNKIDNMCSFSQKKWQVVIIKFNVLKIEILFYSMINVRIILYNRTEKLHF